jgi:hypothetical protein
MVSGVVSGTWIVFPESLGVHCDEARRCEISEARTSEVSIVVGEPGRLFGRIVFEDPEMIGAAVVVRAATDAGMGEEFVRVDSDQSGAYVCDPLYPGSYDVSFVAKYSSGYLAGPVVRRVILQAAERKNLDVELGSTGTCVSAYYGGQRFTDWDGGVVIDVEGSNWLSRRGSEYCCAIAPGPAVALLRVSKSYPIYDPGRSYQPYYVAYNAQVDLSRPNIRFEMEGATVTVIVDAVGSVLPMARLVRIGRFGRPVVLGRYYQLAYEDEDAVTRRFPRLPIGATVEIVSEIDGYVIHRREVVIDSASDLQITWPPQ